MKATLKVRTVPISELHEDPANLRRHDEKNLAAIKASLTRFGQQKPIVVDRAQVVRAGNGTLAAARALGWTSISVVESELSDVDLAAFAIADNRTSDLSDFDEPELARFLEKLEKDGINLADDLAFDERDMAALNRAAAKDAVEGTGVEEQIEQDLGDSVPERVKRGEVWLLGGHRLMCGDSTNADDVQRLIPAGVKPVLLATDPPYRIGFRANLVRPWAVVSAENPNAADGIETPEWDDSEGDESDRSFFASTLKIWAAMCVERLPVYFWFGFKRSVEAIEAFADAGLLAHQLIIWDKTRIVPTHNHYGCQFETALYGWPKGMMPELGRRPSSNATNVWQAVNHTEGEKRTHFAQKPLPLWERPIIYHTKEGEWIAEPFAGSGTAIIAAEKHGRRCVAMEIDPRACDRILARFKAFTGQEPVRVG